MSYCKKSLSGLLMAFYEMMMFQFTSLVGYQGLLFSKTGLPYVSVLLEHIPGFLEISFVVL